MNRFKIKIKPSAKIADLTIIYKEGKDKLHEIKTSKKDILANLHYFEQRKKEIDITNMIYIEENIPFEIFSEFISSILTKEADIDETNYEAYLYLCDKYGFSELQEEIQQFSKLRPDIKSIADELSKLIKKSSSNDNDQSNSQENEENYQINFSREEIIAKNLDICIINRFLDQIPIQILIRILNSPKRVIKDHHLLFSFVIELIEKNEKVTMSNSERENLLILPSCLDYCLMTDDEIEKLLEVEKSANFFSSKNAEKKMKQFIEKEAEITNNQLNLQSQIEELKETEKNYVKKIADLEQSLGDMKKIIEEKMELFENEINERKKQETKLFKIIDEQKEMISKNEEKIKGLVQQNEIFKKEQANLKNENLNLVKKLNEKDEEQNKNVIKCQYSSDYFSGIIKYLEGKSKNKNEFDDVVKLSGGGTPSGPITNIIKYDNNNYYYNYYKGKATETEGWILFDFINRKIKLSSYVIRNRYSYHANPKSWIITGSNDGSQWDNLDQQTGFSEFKKDNLKTERFECKSSNKYYRYIKYVQNEGWPDGYQYSFSLCCVEFFGSILET